MAREITISASTRPVCSSFFKIREQDSEYQSMEEFTYTHSEIDNSLLQKCFIKYRDKDELTYEQYVERFHEFVGTMRFVNFKPSPFILEQSIKPSVYFAQKADECLQAARFFTIKSYKLFDSDDNLSWSQGYTPQFFFRCLYFGTASTWYINTYDQILQTVYWGKKLYTSAKLKNGEVYNDTWTRETIMEHCKYEFVKNELENRNMQELQNKLCICYDAISEVRKWANYIKHKGGVDYKFLNAPKPFGLFWVCGDGSIKREITDFESPIEVDIDKKIPVLVAAHTALYDCINAVIGEMDYKQYAIQFGGKNDGQDGESKSWNATKNFY